MYSILPNLGLGRDGLYFLGVTVCTLVRRWFIEDYRFVFNYSQFLVTFFTRNFRMATCKWEVRPGVVIKDRGNPALDVVALRAAGLTSLRELGTVRIRVAVFADLRGSLELSRAGT